MMRNQAPFRSPQNGFTLLEVMVALGILAVLTVATSNAITSGLQNKAKFQADVARESGVRDALAIMQADVAAAFHHRDIIVAMMNDVSKGKQNSGLNSGANPNDPMGGIIQNPQGQNPQTGQPGQPQQGQNQPQADPNQALPPPRPTPVNLTGFVGDSSSMFFTVRNNARMIRDSKESDQAKVGYYVRDCKSHTSIGKGTKCLVRALSPVLDDDVTKTGPETVLLENVTEFKLLYIVPGAEEPVEKWKVGAIGREKTDEQNFPLAVEISLAVHDLNNPKDKPFSGSVLAPIHFPNNPPKKNSDNQGGEQGAQNPNGGGNGTGPQPGTGGGKGNPSQPGGPGGPGGERF
jgi:prepilin-type N-terminal cleavage/methylation domain-containing protein